MPFGGYVLVVDIVLNARWKVRDEAFWQFVTTNPCDYSTKSTDIVTFLFYPRIGFFVDFSFNLMQGEII